MHAHGDVRTKPRDIAGRSMHGDNIHAWNHTRAKRCIDNDNRLLEPARRKVRHPADCDARSSPTARAV